jgi:group I intron endonuclease
VYKIYKLVNTINGKLYIGQTILSFNRRFKNGKGYDGCLAIARAIKKYGKEQFQYEVLCVCSDQETANYLERAYIKEFNSMDFLIGYNIREGGFNGKISPETRQKMSMAAKGRKLSDEHKDKISASLTGKKHTNESKFKLSKLLTGVILSQETKQKMSFSKKKMFEENPEIALKISRARKGIVFSEEHKKNLSDSHKGKTWKLVNGKRVWGVK